MMNRRTYFKQMALMSGGFLLAPQLFYACNSKNEISLKGEINIEPFATFEEMLNAARLSPGHLHEEMYRLIKRKDLKAIYEFVNNRFFTIPSNAIGITESLDTRYGIRGLLRYGKGTIREKSDLLYSMLEKSGFNPLYYSKVILTNTDQINQIFCSSKKDNDIIEVPKSYKIKWQNSLSENEVVEVDLDIEDIDHRSKELSQQIVNSLPKNAFENIKGYNWLNTDGFEFPFVRVTENGKVLDLDVVQNQDFHSLSETAEKEEIKKLDFSDKRSHKVRLILRAIYNSSTNSPTELVRGEWEMEELMGRQVAIQFVPPIPVKQQLVNTFEQLNQFVPFLTLRDSKLSLAERKMQSFSGMGFDMYGNTFEMTRGGVKVNDVVLNGIEEKPTSKVVSVKAVLSEIQYPKIQIRIAPLDKDGEIVYGLGGGAFSVIDNDVNVLPVVKSNFRNVRILVLIDQSNSMPPSEFDFRDEKISLINALEKEYFDPIIEIVEHSDLLKDEMQNINAIEYDHILFLGDGGAFVGFQKDEFDRFAKDVPCTFFYSHSDDKTYSFEDNSGSTLFKDTSRNIFKRNEFSSKVTNLAKAINKNNLLPYVLEYQSPETGKSLHNVVVKLAGESNAKEVNLEYSSEEGIVYKEMDFPIGLSLEIQYTENYKPKSVYTNLVGFNELIDTPDSFSMGIWKKQVKSFLLGTHIVSFEGDKPTYPVLVDDLLSAQLSKASLLLEKNMGTKEMLGKLSEVQLLPPECLTVFTGIPDAFGKNRITFENQFQTSIYSEYYDSTQGESIKRIDMLETSDIHTFAPTKKEAFNLTLEKTCYLALSESHYFSKSTLKDLKGKALKLYQSSDQKHPFYPLFEYVKSSDYHVLFDASLQSSSYWQINKTTGALLGILHSGFGGGLTVFEKKHIDMTMSIWETWIKHIVKISQGGLSMGIVILHNQFLSELYGLVSLEDNDLVAIANFENNLENLVGKYAQEGLTVIKRGN